MEKLWIILGVPKTLKVKFDGFYRHNLVRGCQSGERIGREMNEGTRPTWVGLA